MACGSFKHTPGRRCCCCCVREIDFVWDDLLAVRVPVTNTSRSTIAGTPSIENCVYQPSEFLNNGSTNYLADVVLLDRDLNRSVYDIVNLLGWGRWRRGIQKWVQAFIFLNFTFNIQNRSDGKQRFRLQANSRNQWHIGARTGFRTTVLAYNGLNCVLNSDVILNPGYEGWNVSHITTSGVSCEYELNRFGNFYSQSQLILTDEYSEWLDGDCKNPIRNASLPFALSEWNTGTPPNNCRTPQSITDFHAQTNQFSCYSQNGFGLVTESTPNYGTTGIEVFADDVRVKVHYCGDPNTPLEEIGGPGGPI